MKAFWRPVLAILWKDILLEIRTKDMVASIFVFAVLVIVIFNFALDPTPPRVALVAPGILWVAITFAGVLGLTRSFALEKQRDSLYGLMLAPVGRDAIFFGKMLSNFLFMVLVEVVVFPVFAALFDVSLWMPELIPVALLATLGFSSVGTVFSAMAVNTRAREVMLPLLFFPVVLPAIVAALTATEDVFLVGGWGDVGEWLPFLLVFDAIFLVVAPIAFHFVVQE